MKVEYEWLPSRCDHCCVFGHDAEGCPKQARQKAKAVVTDAEGFTEVQNQKNSRKPIVHISKPKFEYRPIKNTSKAPTNMQKVTLSNSFGALNQTSVDRVHPAGRC